jgi:peptidoglycan/xylan/chitin deacetylase (PgdA/CDA1 family)
MRPPLVLAYHALGRHSPALDPHNLVVDPARFRRQVSLLRRRGYRFIPLSELARHLDGGSPLSRTCVLTFDDGTVDALEVVAPLLEELDVPATFFACPGLLGKPHVDMPSQAGVRLMNADQLRRLASVRLAEIGSHTNTHADLSAAGEQDAYREMSSSKQSLEELLQQPVSSFAYPRCGYSPACPQAARRSGYSVAVTCGGLGGWRRFELARESVDSLDGRVGFALKSRGWFWPLRRSLPGRLARATTRPLRHGTVR